MNYSTYLKSIFIGILVMLASCSKESDMVIPPSLGIVNLEFGSGHSSDKTIKQGGNIHIGAAVYAEAKIKSITVEIFLKEGKQSDWKLKEVFTEKYKGAKEVSFHQHVDISYEAKVTDYILVMTVEDDLGNKKAKEGILKVLPYTIMVKNVKYGTNTNDDNIAVIGKDLSVEAYIEAKNELSLVVLKVSEFVPGEGWKTLERKDFDYTGKNLTKVDFKGSLPITNNLQSGKTYDIDIVVVDKKKEQLLRYYTLKVA
ncbi:Probable lipoprotein precursor [Tenacibaculum maritimum]|uniref:DUF4625 domain-containing protein n=1 Tax=Tenacibaculum maritimum TaxID=107401 RepID=UPI0012E49BF2|nr:DUF4625 domain-containing protein [Tenacibaculum maritimum]CAA0222367.1 Probable lipoprotein precursor [Tenacibaculum maritimum]CAA0257712.1 Probable lipoprotein precursor [Tenacibaculum maritimum]